MNVDDPQTRAATSLAWLIVFNKPFYPLYLYWIADIGLAASWPTMLSMPLFALLPVLSKNNTLWVRLGVPALGLVDTVLTEKLFGQGSGAMLFLAPCLLLVAVSLRTSEKIVGVGYGVCAFIALLVLHGRLGAPVTMLTPASAASVYALNLYSIAALCLFILWRFGHVPKL